ncbi:MAG: PIN domain-containing protein [Spirochaetia bacterium]|jgi:predicted nucleic acid-binding protein
MITAVDSSVILDVLTSDSAHAGASLGALRKSSLEGRLIIGECVVAEILPAFEDPELFESFLQDWGLEFVPSTLRSATTAGRMLRQMLVPKKGRKGRILADFLIGAHALEMADRLLARDRGYLRDYFADLVLWDPAGSH